ncbi:hypothetical protein [Pelagibius sp. Alg239-R121]|uniref:hypothetical protein n=1 Tax=Pelagibius sp. Alg239-R121 TaxID=2993448 RepID=UPI0024A6722B|nr:hypothetical protein [Pelagibius sp. Alg239-R121]
MNYKNSLKEIYDGIWSRARDKALRNEMASDLPPDVGETRWGLSFVLRVPFLNCIEALSTDLIARAGPGHLCYDAGNFHMTLRSLEGYRGAIAQDDDHALLYVERVIDLLPMLRGLTITLRGLTCGNSSALVQGWPDGDLQPFRLALFHALEDVEIAIPSGEVSPERVRNTTHASLLLMNGKLSDPAGFARIIDDNRATNFGSFTPDAVELVCYRRTAQSIGVEPIASIPIG